MMLLQRGAHINARNRHNQTPADQATENGKAEVASFLFLAAVTGGTNAGSAVPSPVLGDGSSEGGSRTPDRGANGALYTAAEEGNLEAVRSLLAKGVPDVNARDPEHHKTALDMASTTGNLEIARLLIGSSAEVDCRNKTGWTPLHRASRFGHRDVARLLLDKGADVNAKKQDHWTPLHLSSRNGHLETVRLLLERGADVHVRNDEGRTPLQAALGKGHNAVVQLLSGHAASDA
jgi:ankyrin repeat protein